MKKVYNKFKIISPSYNNESWVDTHIESILEQTYENYEVLYIDDKSTDNTWKLVNKLVGNNVKFRLIKNKKNQGATYNYTKYLDEFNVKDEDIIIHLDGDDWFATPDVLENLNNFYNEHGYWMTYGGFLEWDGGDTTKEPFPQNSAYDKFVHESIKYREDVWRASHLRTYKGFLFRAIDQNDFISKIDNKLFWHASDLAWAFPCLEMCPSERIGVVNFVTCVYNASQSNQTRTQEREANSNIGYEIELRNKKKYKRVNHKGELNGEKLHQVNTLDERIEMCSTATKFSYCQNQRDGEFDMFLLNDGEILEYINGNIKIEKDVPIVARLHEQRDYFKGELMRAVLDNYKMFDTVLTFDKILLENIPNARYCNPEGITQFVQQPNRFNEPPYHSELYNDTDINQTIKIYEKTKFDRASCITTNKAFLPGHTTRLNFVNNIKDRVDLYGRGIREIPSKLDVLHNYAFSVAIENNTSKDDYYFTEKLLECFVTGTVPIYHGCPNINEYFDMNGVLTFSTQEELDNILDNLSEEKYKSMLNSVKLNFKNTTENFVLHNDSLYELHFKHIIENRR